MENALAVGALVIIAEIVELSIFRDWEEWINVVLGALARDLAVDARHRQWGGPLELLIVGTLVVALARYEIRELQAAAAEDGPAPQ